MSGITNKIPTMKDQDLFNLFRNVVRMLAEEKKVEEVNSVLTAIESEWQERLNQAQVDNHSASKPTVGMLAALGYHVGSVSGERTSVRKKILSRVLEGQLPMVGSPAYTYEWGTPN